MQIFLEKHDIEAAIRSYVSGMGIGAVISQIEFSQTRSPPSIRAEVTLGPVVVRPKTTAVDEVVDAPVTQDEAAATDPEEETPVLPVQHTAEKRSLFAGS